MMCMPLYLPLGMPLCLSSERMPGFDAREHGHQKRLAR